MATTSESMRLKGDVVRLQQQLDRYRAAAEAGLDSLDEAISWLDRNRRAGLARDLRRNRKRILQNLRSG
jgi:hypothetical protein